MDDLLDGRRVLAHLLGEGVMGNPASRLASRDLLHHLVDLLERQTLGLRNEEVSENDADGASGAPEEEDLRSEVGLLLANKVRSNNCDNAVPKLFYMLAYIQG